MSQMEFVALLVLGLCGITAFGVLHTVWGYMAVLATLALAGAVIVWLMNRKRQNAVR